MANQEDFNKQIQTAAQSQPLETLIKSSIKEIRESLPAHLNAERLTRIALTCIRQNQKLAQCTPASFLGALFVSAQIGIEPIAGRAYILPFNNNKKKPDGSWHSVVEAQFILGYKGLGELFYRHEKAVQLSWGKVYKNDDFDYEYGTKAYLKHKPANLGEGDPIYYYVIAKLQGGGEPFQVMTREQCLEHGKKHSKTFNKKDNSFSETSPWVKDADAMCLKTVLIQLAKLLPLSVELQKALSIDETSREYRHGINDAIDLPDNTNWLDDPVDEEPTIEKTQKEKEKAELIPPSEVPLCYSCDKIINEAEKTYSLTKFKKQLCRDCQREESKKGELK